jgi:hypothetical protein
MRGHTAIHKFSRQCQHHITSAMPTIFSCMLIYQLDKIKQRRALPGSASAASDTMQDPWKNSIPSTKRSMSRGAHATKPPHLGIKYLADSKIPLEPPSFLQLLQVSA